MYPFLIVALFPDGGWGWATVTYLAMLASVVVVNRLVPGYLDHAVREEPHRPAAGT